METKKFVVACKRRTNSVLLFEIMKDHYDIAELIWYHTYYIQCRYVLNKLDVIKRFNMMFKRLYKTAYSTMHICMHNKCINIIFSSMLAISNFPLFAKR